MAYQRIFVHFVLALVSAANKTFINGSEQKASSLSLLVFLPITGDAPQNGNGCRAAVQVVLDEVNSRHDILPNYHVEPFYDDEGPNSALVAKKAVLFKRRFEQQSDRMFESPLTIGALFPGSKALAGFAHHLNTVHLAFGVSTPVLTARRSRYPNFYRSRIAGDLIAYSQMHFIREIGRWNRFAIITSVVQNTELAIFLQKVALDNGFEISHFDTVIDVDDESMVRLVQSDSRIILLATGVSTLTAKFICQTHKFGITGERYLFILHMGAYTEPSSLPASNFGVAGCTREIVFEQLKYTFWIGWSSGPASVFTEGQATTSLGWTLEDFERKYEEKTNSIKDADMDRRFLCHDTILEGILALDRAERILNVENMTLADYKHFPRKVTLAINDSISNTDFVGLRIGRIRYSARKEVDNDEQIAAQWVGPADLRIVYKVVLKDNMPLYNYSSYETTILADPLWSTANGTPPNDRKAVVEMLVQYSVEYYWSILSISLAMATTQIAVFIKFRATAKLVFLVGCLLLDLGAMAFAQSVETLGHQINFCYLQFVPINLGLGAIVAYLISRVFYIRAECAIVFHGLYEAAENRQRHRAVADGRTFEMTRRSSGPSRTHQDHLGASTSHAPVSIPKRSENYQNKRALSLSLLYLAVIGATTAVWIFTERPKLIIGVLDAPISGYDYSNDVLTTKKFMVCRSANEGWWIGAVVAFHLLQLLIASFEAFSCRELAKEIMTIYPDFQILRIALANVATLLCGGILIGLAISDPTTQFKAVSVIQLTISATTSILILPKRTQN